MRDCLGSSAAVYAMVEYRGGGTGEASAVSNREFREVLHMAAGGAEMGDSKE